MRKIGKFLSTPFVWIGAFFVWLYQKFGGFPVLILGLILLIGLASIYRSIFPKKNKTEVTAVPVIDGKPNYPFPATIPPGDTVKVFTSYGKRLYFEPGIEDKGVEILTQEMEQQGKEFEKMENNKHFSGNHDYALLVNRNWLKTVTIYYRYAPIPKN